VERLAYTAEEGIRIPALLYYADAGEEPRRSALVYVDEDGKRAEAGPDGLCAYLARRGCVVMAVDVRGLGETALPGTPLGDGRGLTAHGSLFGHDAVHAVRTMALGRPLFGMRVLDALRGAEYLRAREEADPARVFIAGRGMGALIALYAAALDPCLAGAFCEEGLQSYESVVAHREYAHFMNVFLPGVLREYDLRDVAACVAPRPLMLLNVVDYARRWLEQETVDAEAAWARQVYTALSAGDRLMVRSIVPQHEAWRRELYRWWLTEK
jgi:dienelactone hydrolase